LDKLSIPADRYRLGMSTEYTLSHSHNYHTHTLSYLVQ
jgi:hypothetical protein